MGGKIPSNSISVVVNRSDARRNVEATGCQLHLSMVFKLQRHPVEGFHKYAPSKDRTMSLCALRESFRHRHPQCQTSQERLVAFSQSRQSPVFQKFTSIVLIVGRFVECVSTLLDVYAKQMQRTIFSLSSIHSRLGGLKTVYLAASSRINTSHALLQCSVMQWQPSRPRFIHGEK